MTPPLIRRFADNPLGRDLIVGDVHGCFSKLQTALDVVGFDPSTGDRLFSVGDLVDRGPESALALDWLARPWFHAVQGNHEAMAVWWANGGPDADHYAANGGAWNIANSQEDRQRFADAFAALPLAIELWTPDGIVGIVHADTPFASWQTLTQCLDAPGLQPAGKIDAIRNQLQWSRDRIEGRWGDEVAGVRAVVVGHTPVERPTSLGNVIYIDTGAWLPAHRGPRPFCLLDAETLRPATPKPALEW